MPGIPVELVILTVVMLGFFWLMNRGAKKAQKAQLAKREEALVVGNNVMTQAGFFGRIVDIDGDAVTLESPSGDETVWLRTAIVAQMDIPLGNSEEDETEDVEAFLDSQEADPDLSDDSNTDK
ncbi:MULTISPECIES: preprotein translocase subunit YajC [Trueperella]|uniref:Preprotein translocase subunit YajC n=1 Tax=Trueperella bernardiae TaxID=59561 RepID=A0A0W1KLV0_9ACTO|nr:MULTISPECIES: preprotein translocase subunit YajC [Trueperella]KTF04948.1 preprotein translocase subunit YajC [Trueperella bernardiae]MCM3906550.1 preprotein translocase subunit YajC [Trueperella bernardiae]MDK8601053.1 preprotein translocase subunit YajC [Trueperella bernardiae]MDV6238291.1 preprotein translocase subunit YajC [Trueperella bernardiae]OFS68620.1 hypothetical protein HMPREF3174_01390 [Trueperella sp. HMSC08H06]